ncbi:hypothetical protein ACIA8I_22480 [Streptomyces rishiriensis]|uniref:hypothetical protein n=1 Tax=Streptomyces rishiriensis TaxID=68264 RepID=UPI00378B7951
MSHHPHQSQLLDDLDTRLVRAGAALTAVGVALACSGMALAGFAVFSAGRRRIHRMEVPPTEQAAEKWRQAKEASRAGMRAWQDAAAGGNGVPPSGS